MTRLPLCLVMLLSILFGGVHVGRAADEKEPSEFDNLKADYLLKRQDVLGPVTVRYRDELEQLSKRLMQKNDLDGAVFTKQELDVIQGLQNDVKTPTTKEPAELVRMRKDYALRCDTALKPVNQKYLTDLDLLAKKLMQKNDLDGAMAVKKELDAARASGALDGMAELRKALLATHWSWVHKAGENGVEMKFSANGKVSHIGMHGTWKITGLRDVTITISSAEKRVLRFDTPMKSYAEVPTGGSGKIWK
jgi:hypothetical protein